MPKQPETRNPKPQTATLDVLALAAHPDDVELCAGGTMCLLAQQGYRTGVVDFTKGQLGSRGTPEGRLAEAERASEIMGLAARENLGMMDGGLENTRDNQLKIIRQVRRFRPHVVLVNALQTRHPDHRKAARLSLDALFYGGLRKIETTAPEGSLEPGEAQEPWRPHHVLHYMQAVPFDDPTLVVDVTDVWDQRIDALQAFASQFFNPDYDAEADEPETFVSNRNFFDWVEARARTYGYKVGATFGEPFRYHRGPFGARDLMQVLGSEKAYR
jgi:bacillithiol biosynthesis deacetylase BshB1